MLDKLHGPSLKILITGINGWSRPWVTTLFGMDMMMVLDWRYITGNVSACYQLSRTIAPTAAYRLDLVLNPVNRGVGIWGRW